MPPLPFGADAWHHRMRSAKGQEKGESTMNNGGIDGGSAFIGDGGSGFMGDGGTQVIGDGGSLGIGDGGTSCMTSECW
jgi:hypothetical protein